MNPAIEERVAACLEGRSKRRRFLVGVSGGRDSVALLDLLLRLGFHRLIVCHLDHGLRGRAARGDARFVGRLAARLGLDFESGRIDLRSPGHSNGSLENAARDARYRFFAAVARRRRCRTLLLGHHADDRAETFLFNLLRGAGAGGLSGMRSTTKRTIGNTRLEIIRPLLQVTRDEIDAYVRSRRLAFRNDATNLDIGLARNNLRHRLIPLLSEMFGRDVRGALRRTADIATMESDWLDAQLPPAGTELAVKELRAMHPALQRRHILATLRARDVPNPGFAEVEAIRNLLARERPSRTNLPGGLSARRRQGRILIEPQSKEVSAGLPHRKTQRTLPAS